MILFPYQFGYGFVKAELVTRCLMRALLGETEAFRGF